MGRPQVGGADAACTVKAVVQDLQRAGCQVGVLMLQLAIQRQATLLPVVGQERRQCEHLAEGGAGRHQVTADRG